MKEKGLAPKEITLAPPVIVAGGYRSGTSLTAGILATCGAWTGRCLGGNRFNPKGYFENERLRSVLHLMLQMSGFNDSDNLPPENLIETRATDRLRHILENLFAGEGYRSGPRLLKNPKIIFFWRYFDAIYPNAKWVVVRRSPEAVVASMKRVNALTLPPSEGPLTVEKLKRVVETYNERLDSLLNALPAERVYEVQSEDIVSGKPEDLKNLVGWAGLPFKEEVVRKFIEPGYFGTKEEAA